MYSQENIASIIRAGHSLVIFQRCIGTRKFGTEVWWGVGRYNQDSSWGSLWDGTKEDTQCIKVSKLGRRGMLSWIRSTYL